MNSYVSTPTPTSHNTELIPFVQSGNTRVPSARNLYDFLEVSERFSRWFDRMVEYGFEENKDYTPYHLVHPLNNQEFTDYALTLDTAKEIAMVQRSEKGRIARQYYINAEKELKQIQTNAFRLPATYQDALRELADKEDARLLLEQQNTQLTQHNNELKEAGKKMLPAFEYCNDVRDTEDLISIQTVAKSLGYDVGPNQLFEILRKEGVLKSKGKEKNQPYSHHMDKIVLRESSYTDVFGKVHINHRPFVTMRGKAYINKLLKKKGYTQKFKNN